MQAEQRSMTKEEYVALAAFRAELRRFLNIADARARAAGVTPQQHQLLLAIKGQPGRDWAAIRTIAEALQIKHHTAIGLIDRCVAAGLVARSADPEDRRQVRVSLTPEGETVLRRVSQQNLRELEALRAALGRAPTSG